MTLQPVRTIRPHLLCVELGAAVCGGTAASAEERITLEVIGAVRMAIAEEIRRTDAAPHRAETKQIRETAAEQADAGMSSHRD